MLRQDGLTITHSKIQRLLCLFSSTIGRAIVVVRHHILRYWGGGSRPSQNARHGHPFCIYDTLTAC